MNIKLPIIVFILFLTYSAFADNDSAVTTNHQTISLYQTVSFDVILSSTYENPFNTKEILVKLTLTTPSNKKIQISGFYHSDSKWQIRYAPDEIGRYQGEVLAYSLNDSSVLDTVSFNVGKTGRERGFIRMNPESNYSFVFESGMIFRGIGENVCWADDYEYYFKKLNDIGCNITRIWMCPWNLKFEWSDTGVGRYNLDSAARLDSILKLAEKYGIYIMLVFDYHGVIQQGSGHFNENTWADNPYNFKNGGPCKESKEFFSNPVAKQYYKNRLRYLVARYAHSQMIHSWEFWNEVDLTTGQPEDVIKWHDEMSSYLRSIDPYDHLITSSFANPKYPDLWKVPNLDFSQHHIYGARDLPHRIEQYIKKYTGNYSKPHFIGEYGVSFRGADETRKVDPEYVGFHNALWAGLMAETPIIPMTWWWDNLVDPDSLYYHFDAVSKLWFRTVRDTSRIDHLETFVSEQNTIVGGDSQSSDLTVYPIKKWGKNTVSQFEIDTETGRIENYDRVPYQIYGSLVPEWRNPPEFIITYTDSGRFTVHIDRISHHGRLNIFLNNKLIFDKVLPMEPGKGDPEEIHWNADKKRYEGIYNKSYSVNIPPGTHSIRVENGGLDYFEVTSYTFENCGIVEKPVIEARGIKIDTNALIWLRNSFYTWKRVTLAGLGPSVSNAELIIPGLGIGDFSIEWWDTWQGRIIGRDFVNSSGSSALMIRIPPLKEDLALRIIYIPPLTLWEILSSALLGLLLLLVVFWSIKREIIKI